MTCGETVRGGGTCTLEQGHRGYHATITFACDGCGATRRGYAHATSDDGEFANGLAFCFLCTRGVT